MVRNSGEVASWRSDDVTCGPVSDFLDGEFGLDFVENRSDGDPEGVRVTKRESEEWVTKKNDKTERNKRRMKGWKKNNNVSDRKEDETDSLSLQQQLALTALNLTAPACSSILSNQRQNWVQLSGHPGALAPAGPCTIWKKQPGDTNETWVYEMLTKDSAQDIVPKFYKEIHFEGDKFIEISDLLYGFSNPCLMDIKMGTRTFLEKEVSNTVSRKDLYLKMIEVDTLAPTPEEHRSKAVTKLRYMDFRDTVTSSRSLGFRIDALKMTNSPVTVVKKVRTREEVVEALTSFIQRRESTKKQIIGRLKVIRSTFENSDFFRNHEVIGSSILILYDDTHSGAWIIDFAKTCPLAADVKIDHRTAWHFGNHEEGYLNGLDNLVKAFECTAVDKKRKLRFFGKS